ncbi:hypothetical protein OH77DRAFT_1087362 [Trametes cingulata]|nr:hypothetical protein OH77DRAFT_1087362 [Trametes cingulata]
MSASPTHAQKWRVGAWRRASSTFLRCESFFGIPKRSARAYGCRARVETPRSPAGTLVGKPTARPRISLWHRPGTLEKASRQNLARFSRVRHRWRMGGIKAGMRGPPNPQRCLSSLPPLSLPFRLPPRTLGFYSPLRCCSPVESCLPLLRRRSLRLLAQLPARQLSNRF